MNIKNKIKIIWNYLKEQTKKKNRRRKRKKKLFSQTYILYDAGVVKHTLVSELRQYVNIFSQFTIFREKNNQNPKDFIKNNNFFFAS